MNPDRNLGTALDQDPSLYPTSPITADQAIKAACGRLEAQGLGIGHTDVRDLTRFLIARSPIEPVMQNGSLRFNPEIVDVVEKGIEFQIESGDLQHRNPFRHAKALSFLEEKGIIPTRS